jgi:hypothetical protein
MRKYEERRTRAAPGAVAACSCCSPLLLRVFLPSSHACFLVPSLQSLLQVLLLPLRLLASAPFSYLELPVYHQLYQAIRLRRRRSADGGDGMEAERVREREEEWRRSGGGQEESQWRSGREEDERRRPDALD